MNLRKSGCAALALVVGLSGPASAQHFESLPGQGAMQDKVCNDPMLGQLRPGDLAFKSDPEALQKGIQRGDVHVIGNDCQMRRYFIDASGNITEPFDVMKAVRRGNAATAPPPAAAAAPVPAEATASPGWWTVPGFLPLQVDPRSIRPTHQPSPDATRWREEGCWFDRIKAPVGSAIALDNRTIWRIGTRCALEPLVTVTRDPAQPLGSAATRFESARELVEAIERQELALARQQGKEAQLQAFSITKALKGEAMPLVQPGALIQTYPGRAVLLAPEIAVALGLLKIVSGGGDAAIALLLPAGPVTPSAPSVRVLTGEWWNDPNLLPLRLLVPLTVNGRAADGNCTLSNGTRARPGSIVIPEQTRAYYLNEVCRLQVLFALPDSQSSASIAGGGIRHPGNIILPGRTNTPASAELAQTSVLAVTFGRIAVMAGMTPEALGAALAAGSNPAVLVGGAVVISGIYALQVWQESQREVQQRTSARAANGCPRQCRPFPAGTIGYEGPHTRHSHWPYTDHLHLSIINQVPPPSCKCFWNDNDPDVAPPTIQPGWIDINNGQPALSP